MFGSYKCGNCYADYDPSRSSASSSSLFCSYHCEEEHDAKEAREDATFSARIARYNQPDKKPFVKREPRSIRKVNIYTGVGFALGLIGCLFHFIANAFSADDMLAISFMLFAGIIFLVPLPDISDKFQSKIPEEKKCAYTYIVAIIILIILW